MRRRWWRAAGVVAAWAWRGRPGRVRAPAGRGWRRLGLGLGLGWWAWGAWPVVEAADTRSLFDFEDAAQMEYVRTADARATRVRSGRGYALRVETGQDQRWPGVTLVAQGQFWDVSAFAYVTVEARNLEDASVTLEGRVDNAGADGTWHCVTGSVTLGPREQGTLRVALRRFGEDRLDGKLFGMRGYPVRVGGERTIDPGRVTQVLVFLHEPKRKHTFELREVRVTGQYVAPTARTSDADPYWPLVDTFGQYRHRDWPGKVRSVDELRARARAEVQELSARPGPEGWNRWGGYEAGPALKATGFFRTEKHAGRWWLVDPAGRLFWSHGVDCVRMQEFTTVTGREGWFEEFPGERAGFEGFLVPGMRVIKGHYAGQTPSGFSFAGANLLRKHGPEWREEARGLAHRRLRSWGLNTIGNWSEDGLRRMGRTAYVDTITSGAARRIEGSEGYWGKFPDPFDASFRESLQGAMKGKRGREAGDPWCLGFFSDNEIAWGDETSLAEAALRSPADQPAKRVLVDRLRARHGTVEALNAAWGTAHRDWGALLESRGVPFKERARADWEAFYDEVAEAYFRTAREAIKEVAPQQLYLGCRFAWVNARAAAAAARHCDVVTYNLYRRSVADFRFNGGADVPLMIGEFHFGALDRGMFHPGLVPTTSQAERARAYEEYVLGALRHPQVVGCHWFQFQDQPTTGRSFDEENYQIGLVDIADTPYAETIAAVRAVGYPLYRTRLGR